MLAHGALFNVLSYFELENSSFVFEHVFKVESPVF